MRFTKFVFVLCSLCATYSAFAQFSFLEKSKVQRDFEMSYRLLHQRFNLLNNTRNRLGRLEHIQYAMRNWSFLARITTDAFRALAGQSVAVPAVAVPAATLADLPDSVDLFALFAYYLFADPILVNDIQGEILIFYGITSNFLAALQELKLQDTLQKKLVKQVQELKETAFKKLEKATQDQIKKEIAEKEEKAAKKIQKVVRGHQVRKKTPKKSKVPELLQEVARPVKPVEKEKEVLAVLPAPKPVIEPVVVPLVRQEPQQMKLKESFRRDFNDFIDNYARIQLLRGANIRAIEEVGAKIANKYISVDIAQIVMKEFLADAEQFSELFGIYQAVIAGGEDVSKEQLEDVRKQLSDFLQSVKDKTNLFEGILHEWESGQVIAPDLSVLSVEVPAHEVAPVEQGLPAELFVGLEKEEQTYPAKVRDFKNALLGYQELALQGVGEVVRDQLNLEYGEPEYQAAIKIFEDKYLKPSIVAPLVFAGLTDAKKAELKAELAGLKEAIDRTIKAHKRKITTGPVGRAIAQKEARIAEIQKQLGTR